MHFRHRLMWILTRTHTPEPLTQTLNLASHPEPRTLTPAGQLELSFAMASRAKYHYSVGQDWPVGQSFRPLLDGF